MRDIDNIISDLEQQRSAIDRAISALRDIGTGKAGAKAARAAGKKAPAKRRLSPEGKRRIAEAAKRRWAKQRAAQAQSTGEQKRTRKKVARTAASAAA